MTDEVETPAEGMNRRDMLRRSAIIGGAGVVAWAAPTVTAFGPRAFAQNGTNGELEDDDPGTGAASWTMVWFIKGNEFFRVKYEAFGGGFKSKCNAQKNDLSKDESAAAYFDAEEARASDGGRTPNIGCPPSVSVSETSTGSLQITVEGETRIAGWVLKDGTCKQVTGEDGQPLPAVRSAENYKKDPTLTDLTLGNLAGPPASSLPSSSGIFVWQNCQLGLMTTSIEEDDEVAELDAEPTEEPQQKMIEELDSDGVDGPEPEEDKELESVGSSAVTSDDPGITSAPDED